MSDFDITEIDRRLANIAQMGVVEEVAYSNPPKARVRVGELLTGWLRMGVRRAGDAHESWAYSVGEEVMVISTSGNMAQGVIVCALANGANVAQAAAGRFKTTYPGGEIIEIAGGVMTITAPGDLIVKGNVVAKGNVLVNGNVTAESNVTAKGSIASDSDVTAKGSVTANGAVSAKGISLADHVHGGVESGPSNTGRPQ